MADFLLGLDAGSRGVRCSLVPIDGGPVTSAMRDWRPKAAPRAAFFAFDMDPAQCWRLLSETVREAMARARVTPSQIAGMAASGMRFSLVVIDEEGRTLFAVPNQDARAAEQAMKLSDDFGPTFRRRTGHWPTPIFMAPRLQALMTGAADLVARATCALSLSDWIGYKLTGATLTNPAQAGATLLFDLHARDWAWDLIDQLSIPRRLLPMVRESGTQLGGLLPSAAEALGLLAGTSVAMGGADTQCALLGVGATAPGQLGIIAGSTTPLQLVMDSPAASDESRLWTGHHAVPHAWVLESNAGPMGDTLDWFAATLYAGSPDGVARFMAEATRSDVGAGGMAFCSSARVMNAMEMNLPINTLSFSQVEFGDGNDPRGRLSRAVLEGMAHAIRENVNELMAAADSQQPDTRIAGGTTRSKSWMQMLCDVLDRSLLVSLEPLTSGLGAAVCAGTGAGVFPGLAEGASRLSRLQQLTPDPERASRYHELSNDWGRLRRARASTDPLAAGLVLQHMMEQPLDDQPRWDPLPRPLRILATSDLDPNVLTMLGELGRVDHSGYRQALRLLAGDELVEALEGYDVFITEVDIVDTDALLRLPRLRVIAACRGTAVNLDLAACTALGIPVLCTPGRNAQAVADITVAFMLMLSRSLVEANAFLRKPGGEAGDMGRQGQAHGELQGQELGNKTVGLIGLGSVGRAVVRRLQPFGVRVLVHDPYLEPEKIYAEGAEPVPIEQLLETSDFVSLHAAVTDETRSMMDAERFAQMKPGACFINTARGALVDEEALLAALSSGRLAGAGLDVFAVEPPAADHPLLALPNVLATPHIAGNTVDVARHQGLMVAEDLRRMAEGRPPLHVLNPETLGSFSWDGDRPPADARAIADLAFRPRPAVTDLQQEMPRPVTRSTTVVGSATASGFATASGSVTVAEQETAPESKVEPGSTKERVRLVLELFLSRIVLDERLQEFAAEHTVSSHYFLKDLDLEFHIGFRQGKAHAALGPPPEHADVRLKAKAENLDAILTGRMGGNRAAMTGKLSFSGDIALAMSMQKIQPDLIRLYSAAREETGGIDFSVVATLPAASPGVAAEPGVPAEPGAPAEPGGTPSPHDAAIPGSATSPGAGVSSQAGMPAPAAEAAEQPAPAAPSLAHASYSVGATAETQGLRDEMTRVTGELLAANLITATGGNVSVRIPGTSEALITPSQLYKGELTSAMMVRIDLEGNGLDADALAPSSERQLHCEIYEARPDVEAVIHAHPTYATILTMADVPFLPVTTEAAFLGDIPRVPFTMPGSVELAEAVRQALGDGMAVLMQNHGLVVAASSLRHAADTAEVIERVAQMIWGCYALGKEPSALPADILDLLREVGHMIA
jgi:phosphoglycerate dehydrogenase-like enzyme/sugar (pentulose or hexulose) kinase/ribulose-5-phosphate 4-epimerase/fuculose-1-phosphate aldolase/putative sterol carrier protein